MIRNGMKTVSPIPKVDHFGIDMYREQRNAITCGDPLPYPGLPRDWVDQALGAVLLYDPDKVFLFGSVVDEKDTIHSDIDLLVAIDRVPPEQWGDWEASTKVTARRSCPYPVNPFLTDLEDLVRRRHIITNPCKWVADHGRLLYDKHQGKA